MIPPTLHQIYWEFTERGKDLLSVWDTYTKKMLEVHPTIDYVLWDQQMIYDLVRSLVTTEEYLTFTSLPPIVQADFARVAIMYEKGGIYLDRDIIINRPLTRFLLDPKIDAVLFVEGLSAVPGSRPYIGNAAMAATPGCELFKILFDRARKRLDVLKQKTSWGDNDILYSYGPQHLSHLIKDLYPEMKIVRMDVLQRYKEGEQLSQEFYDHVNSDAVYFVPPEALLGWGTGQKGTYFGSHKTHGAWKARFVT